ncbi:MAG: SDR family oxidoreductase [Polyangiaceae bacterium]
MTHPAPLASLFDLEGRSALVTGAANGIGAAIAERLAEAGASVVLADRDAPALDKRVGELRSRRRHVDAIVCDVASLDACASAVNAVVSRHGRIDILVNNAGIFPLANPLDLDEGSWDRVLDVNLKASFFLMQYAARSMRRNGGGGAIVNVTSVDGYHPSHALAHYDASKGGLEMLTRSMAFELAKYGVRVNAVAPGGIHTPGAEGAMASMAPGTSPHVAMEEFAKRVPLGRMGEPDDVARAVLFLVCPASGYVTGRSLVVDGGFLLA